MKRSLFATICAALTSNSHGTRQAAPRKGRLPLTIEEMEARLVMTATAINWPSLFPQPTAAGNALINGLWDSSLRTTASVDYNRDGQLTRNDMIQLFKQATYQYIYTSYADAHDLLTLTNNGSTVGMPASVQNLSSKVLNSSSTTGFYYAGLLYGNQPAYNMISSQFIGIQVNNFFLGQYRPTPSVTFNTNSGPATYSGTYQQVTGVPLFASGGPKYQDVSQGAVGDCWLMASLAEVAAQNPSVIQNMFTDNGDGTYTVRFYNQGTADYVTVDNYLPNSGGTFAHPQGSLWVALAEKAYAEECGYGWIGTNTPNSSSYQALNNGSAEWALQAITGASTSTTTIVNQLYTWPSIFTVSNTGSIASAWQQGKYVVLNTTSGGATVVPSHCYAMVGYNSSTGQFTMFNPWGTGGGYSAVNGQYYPGSFTGNGSSLASNFASWSQTASAPGLAHTATVVVSAFPRATDTEHLTSTNPIHDAHEHAGSTGCPVEASREVDAMLASLSQVHHRHDDSGLACLDNAFSDGSADALAR